MKRLLLTVAVAGLLGYAGVQLVSAHGGYGGYGMSGGYGYCGQYDGNYTDKDDPALEKFNNDTREIRKSIIVKKSELRALMNKDNPDEKRVAQLTGEIFDLEADLDKKADEAGLTGRSSYDRGPGMMQGYGYRNGGRHMMDW